MAKKIQELNEEELQAVTGGGEIITDPRVIQCYQEYLINRSPSAQDLENYKQCKEEAQAQAFL